MPENYFDITLATDWGKHNAGESVGVPESFARNLIAQGIARCPALNPIVAEPPKVKTKPKPKAKAKSKKAKPKPKKVKR